MRKAPKPPQEDPSIGRLRDRQIADLAELDEEENRRLKNAFRIGRGVRAFRPASRGSGAAGGSAGGSSGSSGSSGARADRTPNIGRRQVA